MIVRLVDLETWREQMDTWRLYLTGAADSNGRMGNLSRVVEKLREDVGDSRECAAVRESAGTVHALRRRAWAAVVAAAAAVGASGYGVLKSRDAAVAAEARAAERLDRIERYMESFLLRPSALTPDPARDP
jgi:hypothetical protein